MSARPGIWLAPVIAVLIAMPALGQAEAQALSASFRKAAKAVLPATVSVRGMGGVAPLPSAAGFGPYPARDGVPDMGGSGVVIDAAKGYVLTNDHVVPDAPRVVVELPDGRRRTVKSVRRDPRSDLALLVIDPEGLSDAEWGDSDALDLADWVIAIGQPFGLAGSVNPGTVSGPRRGFGPLGYDDLIQTSAAINAGSSGGPLVDLSGKVVGINVAIKTVSGGYEGVGFAVPASRARRVAADLAEFGKVRRAYLGVATDPPDPERRAAAVPGAIVASLVPGGPAEAAGLRVGDVLETIGGRGVVTPGAVRLAVEFAPIGEPLKLSILRDGERREISITPTAVPDEPRAGRR